MYVYVYTHAVREKERKREESWGSTHIYTSHANTQTENLVLKL